MADKFLIAPIKDGGIQSNVKPWLIMDSAFANLRNMYTWRGSVKKRFGGRVMNESKAVSDQQLFTRLRINLGNTDAVTGNFSVTVPGIIFAKGQMFSIGSTKFTVNVTGTPATLLTTGTATGTYNTTTGALVITGNTENPVTAVFFYPATSVMGLDTYQLVAVNDDQLFAFDTQFAYTFSYTTGWSRSAGGGAASVWTGTDHDFFWGTNWRGPLSSQNYFFVTNNVEADAMRYFDGTNWNAWGSLATTPVGGANNWIITCLAMAPFKGRLLLFNTTEKVNNVTKKFLNRVRYSQVGDPTDATAWLEGAFTPGKGGFYNAPVQQAIVSVEFLKDQLIVGFEDSTWELVDTGNADDPFRWQQINTELGIESTFSTVPFDRVTLGIGSNGIHACNGLNVERIDQVIPYQIFDIRNSNNGPQRVYGIRDYYVELVYWTLPSSQASNGFNETYPNRVLVYDYIGQTWAYNDDSITVFGNYQYQIDFTWADISTTWEDIDLVWDDPQFQSRFKSVIAGNQEGWTFIVDAFRTTNCMALQITDVSISVNVITLTSIAHNLPLDSYVYIQSIVDTGNIGTVLNDHIWEATAVTNDTFSVRVTVPVAGTYQGGGTVQRVSEIEILTKQYNFYNQSGKDIAVQRVDFYVDRTDFDVDTEIGGQVTVDFYVSSSNQSLLTQALTVTGSAVGTNVLETTPYGAPGSFETTQDRFWHQLYFNAAGENVQLRIYQSSDQLLNPDITFQDFQLNAFQIVGNAISQLGTNSTF